MATAKKTTKHTTPDPMDVVLSRMLATPPQPMSAPKARKSGAKKGRKRKN